MPCDVVACAICADPDPCNQQGTAGICEEMKSVDCDAIDGSLNVGEYPCRRCHHSCRRSAGLFSNSSACGA